MNKRKKKDAPFEVESTIETFGEALRFAVVAAEHWRAGPIIASLETLLSRINVDSLRAEGFDAYEYFVFPFIDDGRICVPNKWPREYTESPEDCQRRVVDGFIDWLRRTQSTPYMVTKRRWRSGTMEMIPTRLSPREFLTMACDEHWPLHEVFRWGPSDEESIEMLRVALENARATARDAMARTGQLSNDDRRALTQWRSKKHDDDGPCERGAAKLRYRQVTALRYKGAYSSQESWTGKFLCRFATKTAGHMGDQSHEPYELLPGARERKL